MSDQRKNNDHLWRSKLSDNEYRICREKGTEPAFSGEYWDKKDHGSYCCKCCGERLFDSTSKYDSGSGWPSFYRPVNRHRVAEKQDSGHGMTRTEIVCSGCLSHLGHVFPDGPEPTGLRYCVNSASLSFSEHEEGEE